MPDFDNTDSDAFAETLRELSDLSETELIQLRSDINHRAEQSRTLNPEFAVQLRAIESILSRGNPLVFGQSAGVAPTFLSANQAAPVGGYQGDGLAIHGKTVRETEEIALNTHGDEELVPEEKDYSSEILNQALAPSNGGTDQDTSPLVSTPAAVDDVSDFGDNPNDDTYDIIEGTSDPEPDTENSALVASQQEEDVDPEDGAQPSDEENTGLATVAAAPITEEPDGPEETAQAAIAAPASQIDEPLDQPADASVGAISTLTDPILPPAADQDTLVDDFGGLDEEENDPDALQDELAYDAPNEQEDGAEASNAAIAGGGSTATASPTTQPDTPASAALVSQIADRNDNGVLSTKEEDKFEEIADADASGEVTASEALAFDLIDTNDNGKIGKKELKAFRKIDTDSSGSLTSTEAVASRDALKAQVSSLTKQEKRTLDLAESYLSKYGNDSGGASDVNDAAQALVSNNKTESSLKEKKKKK